MLDELYDGLDMGMEGIFGPKAVEKLLNCAKKQVNKKCKTIADCDALLSQVQGEADKFTQNMEQMQQLAQAFKAGSITKSEFKEQIKAISAQLKDTCMFIGLSDINKKSTDVTDQELANLRAYIIGLTNVIRQRRESLMAMGGQDDTTLVNNTMESIFGTAVLTEDGEYEVVEEGLFSKFSKNGKEAAAEVEAMSDETVLGLYAEYLNKTYGRDLISDEDIIKDSDDTEIVTVNGVKFAKTPDGKYSYVLSKGKGKGTKRRIATTKTMRSKVTDELRKAKKDGAKQQAAEAMIQLMVNSGLAPDEDVAIEAVISALEVATESNGIRYLELFKRGNKFYNQGCALIIQKAFKGAIEQFEKAKAEYEDCIEMYKSSDDFEEDEKDRKNVDTIKGDVTVNPQGGIINLIRNVLHGGSTKDSNKSYTYKPKDNVPKNELLEYARQLISQCNIAIKRCKQLDAEGADKYDWKYAKKEAARERRANKKALKDYKKSLKTKYKNGPVADTDGDDTASESFIGRMIDDTEDYVSPTLEAFLHGKGMCTAIEAFDGLVRVDEYDYDDEYDY